MLGRNMPEWDLEVGTGRVWVDGFEYFGQKVKQRLQLLKGEWFVDRGAGFPLIEEVLVKSPRLDLIEATYRRAILAVPGCLSVPEVKLQFDRPTRKLSGTFRAIYRDGREYVGDIP